MTMLQHSCKKVSDGHLKKAYFQSWRRFYLNYSPSMFPIDIFLSTILKNNKNFSVQINSKPKNCIRWTIAFLSRTLSNKEVIVSTEVNLGDFL